MNFSTAFLALFSLCFFLFVKGEEFYIGVNQSSFAPITDDQSVIHSHASQKEVIEQFVIESNSKICIPTTFYNRGSNVLLVAAPALPTPKESMQAFAQMFPAYDVITFDYRWSGQYGKYFTQSVFEGKLVQSVLFDPIEELETVVQYATKQKIYQKVVGLGECYSCFHFAKLQSDAINKYGSGPFTHLIFDSCWYSLRDFAERICYDPWLPISPQDGGAPSIMRQLTDSVPFKYITLKTAFFFMNDILINQYISNVGIPILFVHGRNDLFVPPKHFGKIWNAANPENRAAFLTPYRHCDNLGNKKLYQCIGEQFVESQSMQEFADNVFR